MSKDIIIGNVYQSNKYGPFKIINDLGAINKNRGYYNRYYEVEFEWSTCRTSTQKSSIINKEVKDPWYSININQIQWSNNYGPFKVLEICANPLIPQARIMFINTNTELITTIQQIKTGYIKDMNAKNTINIDTFVLQPNIRELRLDYMLYIRYRNMKNRCLKLNAHDYQNYGKIGVSICKQWMESLNNFKSDAKQLPGYYLFYRWPTLYELDKDYLQLNIPKEQRIYSPETCIFSHYLDNENIMNYEKHNKYINKISSIYFGVEKLPNNNFRASIDINNKNFIIGEFYNEIAAANAYNHTYLISNFMGYKRYDLVPLINDVPYMDPIEFNQYKVAPTLIYSLI